MASDSAFDPETIQARLATCAEANEEDCGVGALMDFDDACADPLTGYAAALREIQRLQDENASLQIKIDNLYDEVKHGE